MFNFNQLTLFITKDIIFRNSLIFLKDMPHILKDNLMKKGE